MQTHKPTSEELKQKMDECEKKYRASFKGTSCLAIMNSYHDWQAAKKQYYASIGRAAPEVEKDTNDD